MNIAFLQRIREKELEAALDWMTPPARVLEIGAGAGWQARALSEKGFDVQAVDIKTSKYAGDRIWPVASYDGRHLPFEDRSFDIVFSSNVLEHVPHLSAFQQEILRVLEPDGRAIHILPSASWRWWAICGHYPREVLRRGGQLGRTLRQARPFDGEGTSIPQTARRVLWILIAALRRVVPPRHGERGTALSELYYFSRWFWKPFFRRHGWVVKDCRSNRLFYTGHHLLHHHVGLGIRHKMSYLLGSSCLLYLLERRGESSPDRN